MPKYLVNGTCDVNNTPVGSTFEAPESADLKQKVAGGFIEVVKGDTQPAKPSGKAQTPPATPAGKE